jgi:hypothetical protein
VKSTLISVDPLTGAQTIFHDDFADGELVIENVQDAEPIIEANKRLYNSVDERAPWKGGMHRVASIPLTVMLDLDRRGILNDQKKLRKWLNDPENRHFRTRPGRV